MQTINRGGDVLARGGVRMGSAPGAGVSKAAWDEIWKEDKSELHGQKLVYVFKCPVHGIFGSQKECFLSGGYPLLDESKTSKCLKEDCEEVAVYSSFQPA